MAGTTVVDPKNPTLEDFVGQVRELDRRIKSLDRKMEDLYKKDDGVKRFVAYMQVMDEYRKLMNAYVQETGYRYAMKEGDGDQGPEGCVRQFAES